MKVANKPAKMKFSSHKYTTSYVNSRNPKYYYGYLILKDSNQMHAVCLDTYPPISYMTDVSRDIQRLCHGVNKFFGENRVSDFKCFGPSPSQKNISWPELHILIIKLLKCNEFFSPCGSHSG